MNKKPRSSSTTPDNVTEDDIPGLIRKTIPLSDAKDDRLLILGGIGEMVVEALPPGAAIAECTEFFGRIFLRGSRTKNTRHAVVQGKISTAREVSVKLTPDDSP